MCNPVALTFARRFLCSAGIVLTAINCAGYWARANCFAPD